jgi:hypothetical protein
MLGALILFELVREIVGLQVSPFLWFIEILMNAPGAFGVFNGRWMLIDV